MFYVIDYDTDSNVVYESESLESCIDFVQNDGSDGGVKIVEDDLEDDFIPMSFSFRSFFYRWYVLIRSFLVRRF